jgi:sulfur relay (sulfurtransferase) DsrF/TusC family protein
MPATVSVDDAVAFLADSQAARDLQVKNAAALLRAVDAYDKRQARLATAAERREAAAHRLSMAVNRVQSSSAFGNDEIGKLREALGRYDADLAN